jgi:hypothetical protein
VSASRMSTPASRKERHLTVRVLLNARGEWEVLTPHRPRPLRCKSLEEAKRMAYRVASDDAPCDVVVHDAYHRVVHTEHIDRGVHGVGAGAGVN